MTATSEHAKHQAEWKRPVPGQVRVYVWEWPVRIAHWTIFAALIVLSFTGYYIYNPFVIPTGSTAYVMGTMRFIHLLAGYLFLTAFLLRMYWLFRGNRWAQWDQFIPITRERWKDMQQTAKYYSFFRWRPTPHIGHNALAGAAYAVVFGLTLVETLTGMALYSQILGSKAFAFWLGWPLRLMDIQYLREIHLLVMFLFWMFFMHHLYSSVLVGVEEKNGIMESIFTGYKFVTKADLEREDVPPA